MRYRDWLNLNLHLLWCHNRKMSLDPRQTGPVLRFTEYTNSAAWLVREGWARVEHDDGQSHLGRPGQWLIVKPGPRVQSFSRDTRLLSIAFDARWPDGSHLFEEGLSIVIDDAKAPILERRVRPILNAMKRISPESWDARDERVDMKKFLKLEELLCRWISGLAGVLEERGIVPSGPAEYDERVLAALELMNAAELGERFDFEQLAAGVGISPSHLIRLFRQDLQTTPQRYWENLRVEHARRRLLQPKVLVKEVAADLGFTHLSHFTKWFKRHTGKPPRHARRE